MAGTFSNQTILVTGAAGFIGSHLCERLVQEGATVIGVDNFISGRKQNLRSLLGEKVDSVDQTKLGQVLAGDNFQLIVADASLPVEQYPVVLPKLDMVVHLASAASPSTYQRFPIETYQVNSFGTHYLLQYLAKNNPQARFLFASTSEIYGDPLQHPQTESYFGNVNPNGVRSCYDESKRLGETICGVHERDFKLDVRIMRIFNTYGPRINPADGRVVPQFISAVLRGQPITIFGDGRQTRSFCYISDLIEGITALLEHPDAKGETVNLGNPIEVTMLDIAQRISDLAGLPLKIAHAPLPADDPQRRQPDIAKAKKLLNWEPKISLEEGLRQTFAYFQAHETV